MSKYLNQAPQTAERPKKVKKAHWGRFFLCMLLYAIVVLGGAAYGLKYLWGFLESYEASRPKNTVESYMENLTEDHILDLGVAVREQIDGNLQTQEQCREIIAQAISGGVTYAKNSKESSDTRQVYVLRSGGKMIGRFAIEAGSPDEHGFSVWSVREESFDFSFLIGQSDSITVPSTYNVSANGNLLDSSYITEDQIRFEDIEDYYEEYDMPYQVTYTAGPILGSLELTVTDPQGNAVNVDENTDWSSLYENCTEAEIAQLDAFTQTLVERYVAFTGSNKNTRHTTYNKLMEYVVADSNLAQRLKTAIAGLQYGQSKGDKVVSIETHHRMHLEDGKYLCDITYEVDTTGKQGVVRTATSAKLTIVQTEKGLMLESMNIY